MSNTLVLNPAYYLRNDIHRCIIGSFEFVDEDENTYAPHCLHIIHPVIAQLLSFFSCNNKTQSQILDEISHYFQFSLEGIEEIIQPMINNEKPIVKVFNGATIVLPPKVLVKQTNKKRKESYQPQDFAIDDILDLKTNRLYKPIHAVLELTMRCFADCAYCYADRRDNRNSFLPTDLAVNFIREAKSLGFTDIEINGGEVLLHPGIREILSTLRDCGYSSLISTKKPLEEDELLFLKEIGMTRLQISLDSLSDATAKRLINTNKGYIQKMIKTMDLLDQYEFHWQVNTVLTKHNCNINNIATLLNALQSYRHLVSVKLSPMGYPMYKNPATFEKLHASKEQLWAIRQYINHLKTQKEYLKITFSDEDKESDYQCKKWDTFNNRSFCTANQKAFNILPDGHVTICEELYWNPAFVIGDISKNNIMEIWNSPKAMELFFISNKTISKESACFACRELSNCRQRKGVCWKMVIMAYGDNHWDYPDPRCPNAPMPFNKFYV